MRQHFPAPIRSVGCCGFALLLILRSADAQTVRVTPRTFIVSDIAMPNADGYELIQQLRAMDDARTANIPVIALTAYASVVDRKRALELGFDQHLSKPVDPSELVRTIALTRSAKAGSSR